MHSPSPSCKTSPPCGSGPERAQEWGQQGLGEGQGGWGRCRSQAGASPRRANLSLMTCMSGISVLVIGVCGRVCEPLSAM